MSDTTSVRLVTPDGYRRVYSNEILPAVGDELELRGRAGDARVVRVMARRIALNGMATVELDLRFLDAEEAHAMGFHPIP